jgi:hypothetical protein
MLTCSDTRIEATLVIEQLPPGSRILPDNVPFFAPGGIPGGPELRDEG